MLKNDNKKVTDSLNIKLFTFTRKELEKTQEKEILN